MESQRHGAGGTPSSSRNSHGGVSDGPQQQHKPLQEWLESISHRMMDRIDAVGDEVDKLVNECGAVELDLKNTFNSFRCLSSTQFVENRVYEEDETESVRPDTPAKESQHAFAPTESYEDEILPRYKEAVSTAWATFEEINRQHDQASRRLRSRNRVLRSLDYDGHLHLVPHIIGTDEFARDIHCGLAELRHKRPPDGFEVDSDTERESVDLAAELVGTESVSEGGWSEPESDLGDQGGGFEPAVSAALDFKAMLEAALRNPSLPYDGNSSAQDIEKLGEINKDYFLGNVAIDDFYSSRRTMSRTVESGDNRAGETSANIDASDSSSSWQSTGHASAEVAVQSTADSAGASSSLPFQTARNDPPPLQATLEELLKKSYSLKSQNPKKDEAQTSTISNVQVDRSGLANLPFIPGGLFDDDEDETASLSSDIARVNGSNTEPTVPEDLFQRKQSAGTSERLHTESRTSSFADMNVSKSPSVASSSTTARQSPSGRTSEHLETHSRTSSSADINVSKSPPLVSSSITAKQPPKANNKALPVKPEISDPSSQIPPSSSLENREKLPIRLVTSNGVKEVERASKYTAPIQIPRRGSLFDDSDDDDEEDAGELFGKSLSTRVADAAVGNQPALRTWASVSSKGLFDDLGEDDEADAQETVRSQQPAGTTREGQKTESLLTLLRQVSRSSTSEDNLTQGQSFGTRTSESSQNQASGPSEDYFDRGQKQNSSGTQRGDSPASKGKSSPRSIHSGNSPELAQNQSPGYSQTQNSSPDQSGMTPASLGKLSSGSSLSGSSPEPPQKQSPGYSLTVETTNRTHREFPDTSLSGGSNIDAPKSGSLDSSRSSLVGSVSESRVVSNAEEIDSESDGERSGGLQEKTSEPHVSLESLLAAGIRPASRTVVYSSDDSDSWSSSESNDGDDETAVDKRKPVSPNSSQDLDKSVTENLESNEEEEEEEEEDTGRDDDGSKPAAVGVVHHTRSASVESLTGILMPEELRSDDSSHVRSGFVSSSSAPERFAFPRPEFFSSGSVALKPESAETEARDTGTSEAGTSEAPEEQGSVKSVSSSLESTDGRLSSKGQTAQPGGGTSTSADVAAGAEKLIHTTMSRPPGPSTGRALPQSHTLTSTQSLPVLVPPEQIHPLTRKLSEDVTQSTDRNVPATDPLRLRTGRTFTSLFEEDDAEEDLFGSYTPEGRKSSLVQKAQVPPPSASTSLVQKAQVPPPSASTSADLRSTKSDEGTLLNSHGEGRSPFDRSQSRERDEKKLTSPLKGKSPLGLFTTRGRDDDRDFAYAAKINSPLDLGSGAERSERGGAKEALITTTKSPSPLPSRVSTATAAARTSDVKVDGGEQLSGKPASKLSSLLFGDDDEDGEDALFGPLPAKRSTAGSSDWLGRSGGSTSATRRTPSSSLFDD
ncbi:hypothetical protein R1sor_017182 [Riccia sorocarpa]|uniref:Uncharacterized protein n=1 Tax=Riccia sorocarpa TaxID=122646 RepID=A0ABD3I9P3_9MARC